MSGLVNYVPIEQMQDKWLVGVVSILSYSLFLHFHQIFSVQLKARKYARGEKLRDGSLRKQKSK